ncbi:DNA polymerase III subunit chi [Neisseria shayeganii]|uniref:DNA polymerase III subunit chi n=1 Tax=Neisseria shayeganii TaxID=607712 RepID=A0A7D7T521_9NEIS|nr:DNA polymerase III subunit chi [Neisseria shayeganii]QMT39593.1 DNA polymerase III subunit chi [Neisseria shayeganii]
MTAVTFYTHVSNIEHFACRLSKRALEAGSRVLLWSDDDQQIERLDQALWTFEPESFLPHQIWPASSSLPADTRLLLAGDAELPALPPGWTVLNLSPDFWSQAPAPPARILEIIGTQAHELSAARQRFAHYQRHGFTLTHHDMQGKA